MISKTIHYCWFGNNKKPDIVNQCIESWKKYCKEYKIIEWNEENFDINSHPFTKFAYGQKKWAFVSDYVRFKKLDELGGIYLDTDMLLLKPIDDLLTNKFFTAYEEGNYLSCGAIGCEKENNLIKKCLEYYDNNINTLTPVPKILTNSYNQLQENEKEGIKIYPKDYFYPFDQFSISKFNGKNAPKISYGVHMWNYSWGHPILRFLNKFKSYFYFKKLLEKLGIKNIIKKVLGIN